MATAWADELAAISAREAARSSSTKKKSSLIGNPLIRVPLTGLEWAGSLLDTYAGGSSIRDLIAGKNPFDQLIDPFDHSKRISGRDMFRELGVVRGRDDWWNFAGGLAAEILLAPDTYINPFGKLTKAGRIAKDAGIYQDAVALGKTRGLKPSQTTLATPLRSGDAIADDLGAVPKLEQAILARRPDTPDLTRPFRDVATPADLDLLDEALTSPLRNQIGVQVPFTDYGFGFNLPKASIPKPPDFIRNPLKEMASRAYEPVKHAQNVFYKPYRQAVEDVTRQHAMMTDRAQQAGRADVTRDTLKFHKELGDLGLNDPALAGDVSGAFRRVVEDTADSIRPEVPGRLNQELGLAGDTIRDDVINRLTDNPSAFDDPADLTRYLEAERERLRLGDISDTEINSHMREIVEELQEAGFVKREFRPPQIRVDVTKKVRQEVAKLNLPPAIRGEVEKLIAERAKQISHVNQGTLRQRDYFGLSHKSLTDRAVQYLARYVYAPAKSHKVGHGAKKAFVSEPVDQATRSSPFKDIRGGTTRINQIAQDPQVADLLETAHKADDYRVREQAIDDLARHVRQEYGDEFALSRSEIRTQERFDTERVGTDWLKNKSESFARQLYNIFEEDPEIVAEGVFKGHVLNDQFLKEGLESDAITAMRGLYSALSDPAVISHKGRSGKTVSIREILQANDIEKFHSPAGEAAAARLAKTDIVNNPAGFSVQEWLDMRVSKEVADDLTRGHKSFRDVPESFMFWVRQFDKVQNMFRTGVTTPWPAFHVRNYTSGMIRNYLSGQWSGFAQKAAHEIATGKVVKGLKRIPAIRWRWIEESGRPLSEMTDEAATEILRRLATEHELTTRQGLFREAIGDADNTVMDTGVAAFGKTLPGKGGANPLLAIGRAARDSSLLPFGKKEWVPVAAGNAMGEYVETINRMSPFIHNLKKGVSVDEAARRVKWAQIDYSPRNFTEAERAWFKRAFPFYSFLRHNTPVTMELLLGQDPSLRGIVRASTMRQEGDQDLRTPDHIRRGVNIPLGRDRTDQANRFLTGFGLMEEDTLSLLGGPGDVMQGLAGRLSPFIQYPIEKVTGQSLFFSDAFGGTPTTNLDPSIGRIGANTVQWATGEKQSPFAYSPGEEIEAIIAKSPLGRAVSSLRTATDQRKQPWAKGINLLTGGRLADIPDVVGDFTYRDNVAKQLLGIPQTRIYRSPYVRKDDLADLSEEERRQVNSLLQILRQRN